MGMRERPAGESARQGADRSPLSGQVSRQRADREHARVRACLLLQGRAADGGCESLPCLVASLETWRPRSTSSVPFAIWDWTSRSTTSAPANLRWLRALLLLGSL